MKKGYLLVNPISGRFHSRHLINLAAKMFRDKGWDLNVIETLNRTQTAEVAKDAVKKEHDAIFVAGGAAHWRDGHLHDEKAPGSRDLSRFASEWQRIDAGQGRGFQGARVRTSHAGKQGGHE